MLARVSRFYFWPHTRMFNAGVWPTFELFSHRHYVTLERLTTLETYAQKTCLVPSWPLFQQTRAKSTVKLPDCSLWWQLDLALEFWSS